MKYPSYPEMKDSGVEGLGKIPKHWKTSKLKYVCSENVKYGLNESDYVDDGIRLIRATDITDRGDLISKQSAKYLDIESIDDDYLLQDGDILLSRSGTIGLSFHYEREKYNACTYASYLVRFRPDRLHYSKYIFYFTKSTFFYDQIYRDSVETTISNFNGQKYANMYLPEFSFNEQKAIATFLDQKTEKIDKLIKKKEKLIELLEVKRQAIISRAVTKGLDSDVPMKDSGIEWLGKIPEHWEVGRLKYLIEINPSNNGVDKLDKNDEVTFLPMEKIYTDGSIENNNTKKINEIDPRFTCFGNDDVLLAKITPCFENGKIAIAKKLRNGIGYGTTELHILRAKSKIKSKFIYYMLRNNLFMKLGEAEMTGAAGQKRVPKEFVENYAQGIPPLEEQKQIIYFLDNITDKIKILKTKIQKQITNLKEYRQALITNAVTGKIDVRDLA